MRLVKIVPAIVLALTLPIGAAFAANDGISQLIVVSQMKADNANDDALQGADKQRDLVAEQKRLRAQQQQFDTKLKGGVVKKQDLPPCPQCVNKAPIANTTSDASSDDDKD